MPKMLVIGLVLLSFATGYLSRGIKDTFFPASPGLCLDANVSWEPDKANAHNLVEPFELGSVYLEGTGRGKRVDVKSDGSVVIEIEEQENNGTAPFGYPTFNIYHFEHTSQKSLDVTQPQEYEQNLRLGNLGLF